MGKTKENTILSGIDQGDNLFRILTEKSLAGIYVVQDGKFCFINATAAAYAGYSVAELTGRESDSVVHPEDREAVKRNAQAMLRSDSNSPHEFRIITKGGEVRWIMETIAGISYRGRPAILGNSMNITERRYAEEALQKRGEELEDKTHEMEELNAALRVLLKKREEDRNELEEKVVANLENLVLPYIEKLKHSQLGSRDKTNLNIIEANLKDIITPFSHKLSSRHMNLTARELQVANLIKSGKTTKEIAGFLNVSPSAVNICRYRIRTKLGLNNKKANLQSYLSSLG